MEHSDAFWADRIREQGHAFFQGNLPLWRVSIPPTTAPDKLPGKCFIDWGGALRWLKTDIAPQIIHEKAAAVGGHASMFRGDNRQNGVNQPLSKPVMAIHRNLKRAFDPQGLFNPGRMYPEL